jgi:TolB protein
MWSRRRLTAALGASLVLPAAAQFRVEISGVGATQIPLALGAFKGEAPGQVSLSSVIRADLERSGVFRSLDAPAGLDEGSRLPQQEVRAQGADALLAGSLNRLADGTFDVRYRLWDAVKGAELKARALTVPAADMRLAAHRIADEVFEALTGDKGVFATRIAYVSRSGRQFALHITDADGEGGQIALRSAEPIISPAWSPNGRDIAYVSFESQKAVVWVQDVATGRRTMVANFRGSNSAPAWSPDGNELAVTLSRDAPAQIYVMPRAGGAPRRLTTSPAIDTEPVFSPDGRHVYFVSDRGGGPQIYRVPTAGGQAERVTFSGSYNISPALSPDGRTLAYINRNGSAFRLTTLDLANGIVQTLSDTVDDESPSFAPNGRLLVFATRAQGRDVLMTTTLDGKIKTRLLSSGADMREPAWGPFGR